MALSIELSGTVAHRSILEIVDRLMPDTSASFSSENWLFTEMTNFIGKHRQLRIKRP
jgi:hypothetical protein